ncbi:glycosyl hydrolase family 18 protein [Microbulbifer sp. CAU 1566]|uniref:glycosyl hydrolase family 18 protein n=1 Tax=Microbulbifer sp. CAU 1566 TaxID=2933269 RepID=UPI0020040191|nr:glycosyl hydrolase family 18 protein [Microbulbifer sp. CAU 1566]MCK7597499.1 glycosyl hydrolase family 18 protein [Microbulbifer sp. CAU 1566]
MLKSGALLCGLLASTAVAAYDCSQIPEYQDGASYSTGSQVQSEGTAYQCDVGGWCSQGSAYAPGSGWAWNHAWSDLGACDAPGSSSSSSSGGTASSSGSSSGTSSSSGSSSGGGDCQQYIAGAAYAAGDVVANASGFYACSVAGWCSSGNSAYEPGVGWAWAQAWSATTAEACAGGSSSGGGSGGGTVPDAYFCAPEWQTGTLYTAGSVVAYQGVAYRALVDTHSIAPDNTAYPGQWETAGYPDEALCPVPIPNTIDYGEPQPVEGNLNAGVVNDTGSIAAARIADSQSTLTGTRGGVNPSTDNGGDHGGLDVDNGARGSKLVPGNLALQHNTYDLSAGTEIVTYIGDWAIYGRQYDFTRLPASNLHRIVYGFAGICYPDAKNEQDGGFPTSAPAAVMRTCNQSGLPDGAVAVADFEAAFLRDVGVAPNGVVGTESMYELDKDKVGGVFGVLYQLRQENPQLKLDLSVGGWTLSEGFPWMAHDPERRKVFVDSVVHFLERFDFDGVDIDWEYPGSDGAVVGMAREDDGENYVTLIRELRAGMDWLSEKTGKSYRLSSAIPAGLGRLEKIDWPQVHPYMDRLYAMTYDLTGAWERELSHHTPLYTNPMAVGSSAGTSADWTLNYLKSLGVPANKLMIGAANYHRSKATNPGDISEYTYGLTGSSSYGDSNWTGAELILGVAGLGSWEAGVIEGYDLYQNYLDRTMAPRNGYWLYTDKEANADYLFNDSIGAFISVETPRTVALKAQYAKDNGLAGIFFWMAEQDNGYNLNTVNHVLGNPLISNSADGNPADQIPVCGRNLTVAECESLIAPLQ